MQSPLAVRFQARNNRVGFGRSCKSNLLTMPYLQALRDAQEALGLHNDVGVAAQAFRLDARLHPESWFAAGYLLAHLGMTARAARRALSRLAKTPVFWPR